MKDITVLGIDLAKDTYQVHAADSKGRKVFNKKVSRKKLLRFIANIPACLIGIEACGGAHYWARQFEGLGHQVKMMAPQFVKPYVKSNKNDYNDAEAIAEAVTRPNMRFVPQKSVKQQSIQAIHRARDLLIRQRTALGNHIRGLLMEFGIVLPKGMAHVRNNLPTIIEDAENELTADVRDVFAQEYEHIKMLDEKIEAYQKKLERIARQDERCKRLLEIEGVGELTATAAVAAVGNATVFKNGREMAAWLGLVPKQRSSGNKNTLLGISKRGDRYLRTLLIHGGRAVVKTCGNKQDKKHQWVKAKAEKIGKNKAAVAVANKNARIIWALLANDDVYRKAA